MKLKFFSFFHLITFCYFSVFRANFTPIYSCGSKLPWKVSNQFFINCVQKTFSNGPRIVTEWNRSRVLKTNFKREPKIECGSSVYLCEEFFKTEKRWNSHGQFGNLVRRIFFKTEKRWNSRGQFIYGNRCEEFFKNRKKMEQLWSVYLWQSVSKNFLYRKKRWNKVG